MAHPDPIVALALLHGHVLSISEGGLKGDARSIYGMGALFDGASGTERSAGLFSFVGSDRLQNGIVELGAQRVVSADRDRVVFRGRPATCDLRPVTVIRREGAGGNRVAQVTIPPLRAPSVSRIAPVQRLTDLCPAGHAFPDAALPGTPPSWTMPISKPAEEAHSRPVLKRNQPTVESFVTLGGWTSVLS
ncbi:hypothetical protein AAG570_001196 [Ranatra chinensis]|uniref:Uncharacterized protein n=1 Tax=Ranatra chinensis TaxID=642074 RepID=A0ABD0YMV9_9HEMI